MRQTNIKAVAVLLVCLLAQAATTVSAQHTELKWLRGWKGGHTTCNNTYNQMNGMVVDEEGNTYVAGAVKVDATFLDGTYATRPIDDTLPTCLTHGVMVAKYDTAGNLMWRKVCRSSLDDPTTSMLVSGLEISGDRLYLLMGFTMQADYRHNYNNCQLELWFFDTMYMWPFDYVNNPNPVYSHRNMPWVIPDSLQCFPFNFWNGGDCSAIVVFDLDGNRLEHHSIGGRVPTPLTWDSSAYLPYLVGNNYVVDSKRNICFFVDGGNTGGLGTQIPTGRYYILDEDTSKVLTYDEIYGCTGNGYDSVPAFFHFFKIDSNWNFVEAKPLTLRLDTRQLVPLINISDTARAAQPWDVVGIIISGLSIDEEDNIYLEGVLHSVEDLWRFYGDTLAVDYPYRVYFDSTHYVKVESFGNTLGIPIYAKYDSHGNLLWLNQLYLITEDSIMAQTNSHWIFNNSVGARMYFPKKMTWDSNYVYSKVDILENWQLLLNLGLFPNYSTTEPDRQWTPKYWYLDSNYTMLVTLPDSHAALDLMRQYLGQNGVNSITYQIFIVLVYDRETGAPVRYINPFETIPPIEISEGALAKWGKIITTDDDLLIGCERRNLRGRTERHLLRYNKSSGVTTVLDNNLAHAAIMLENLHPDGWLMGRQPATRTEHGTGFQLYDGTQNAVYASCYYLPDFDRRRPLAAECTPVEEVRVTHVLEDDVTLAWHGDTNHVAWQVAYLPTDAATDSMAWEHALLVESTDTTLTLPLDTCSLLRVRGICDAENHGPWSDAVEACPQPHIGIGNEARKQSGPMLTPNPATEVVTVVDGATGVTEWRVMEIEIISPLGQTVMHLWGASIFNVADLASGTYMVKIRTPRGTTLRKLTIR